MRAWASMHGNWRSTYTWRTTCCSRKLYKQSKERKMREYKKLWLLLAVVLVVTFGVLGWSGVEVYRQVPPIPSKVVTTSGQQIMTEEEILDGQTAWQSTGGMQVGSIWGHGSYQAPDWTADWLHRELLAWLDIAAIETLGIPFDALDPREQAYLRDELKREYRSNTLDPDTLVVTISDRRAKAIERVSAYYDKLYGADPELRGSRES